MESESSGLALLTSGKENPKPMFGLRLAMMPSGIRSLTGAAMKIFKPFSKDHAEGKVGWVLLWLLGVPLPILLLFYVLRGCT